MRNPYVKLKKDEEICSKCNGYGEVVHYITYHSKKTSLTSLKPCLNCKGMGKLDWCRKLILGHIKRTKRRNIPNE